MQAMTQPPLPPPPSITAEQVRKVAALARLAPTDEQIERSRHDLAAILTYIDRLRELDVTGIEPLANPVEEANRLRDDLPSPGLTREALLDMAPAKAGPFVSVPRVLGDAGES